MIKKVSEKSTAEMRGLRVGAMNCSAMWSKEITVLKALVGQNVLRYFQQIPNILNIAVKIY